MARKLLMKQQVKVVDGEVCLTAYKGTSAFQNEGAEPDPFRAIRIFRKAEPEFEFGTDYAEYFDGLSWKNAELIFEGSLTAENNRNFPVNWEAVEYGYGLVSSDSDSATYRGQFAASEPETQAVVNFFQNKTYDAVFSFHALASICGMSFLAAVCAQEDKTYSVKCAKFATSYGRSMAQDNAIRTEQMMSFGTSAGSIPAWCYKNGGIPAFDLEINGKLEPEATAQCRLDKTDVLLLRKYQQRHFNGLVSVMEQLAERTL